MRAKIDVICAENRPGRCFISIYGVFRCYLHLLLYFLSIYVFFMFQKVFFRFWRSETWFGRAAWSFEASLLLHGQKTALKAMFLLFSGVFSPFINKKLDLLESFVLWELFLLSSQLLDVPVILLLIHVLDLALNCF